MRIKEFFLAFILLLTSCEKEITTSVIEDVPLVNRRIFVHSYPKGAQIYINGKIQGKTTPDTINWLPDTSVTFTLSLNYYRDTSFNVIPTDTLSQIEIDYNSNPKMLGRINCQTEPEGAEIILDGHRTGKFTPYIFEQKIPGIYHVKYEKEGYRSGKYNYIVTSDETVGTNIMLEDTTVWVTYNHANSEMPENEVWSVANDKNNVTWIGTAASGLVKYFNGRFDIIPMSYFGMDDVAIYDISVDSLNNIWIGTAQGLIKYDQQNYKVFSSINGELPGDLINSVASHYSSKVWVGTSHGAAEYVNNGWTVYNRNNSEIPGDVINVINTNISGEVWLGLAKEGLAIWNGIRFKAVNKFYWLDGPPPGNTIYAIAQESGGKIWVGFFPEDFPGGGAGGLTSYDGVNWYNKYPGQVSREIYDIVVSSDDKKYVGTSEGLCVFNNWNDRRFFRTENSGLYSNTIHDLEIDREGNLWVATKGGITKFKIKNLDE